MDLKNWKLEVDADNLAWLSFDRAGSATNTLSSEALRELGQIADHLAAMPPKGLAILSAKDNGFAAGADFEEFTRLQSAEEAMAFIRLGNEAYDKIAALRFPTVALVHGFCMGGGTELARGDFDNRKRQFHTVTLFHAPRGGQPRVGEHPFEQALAVEIRCLRDEVESAGEDRRSGGGVEIRIAEDVRVVERALSAQTLGVDRPPAALVVVRNVAVMDVTMQRNGTWSVSQKLSRDRTRPCEQGMIR